MLSKIKFSFDKVMEIGETFDLATLQVTFLLDFS